MGCYVELQVTSNYSFLRGASHPWELVGQAAALGHAAAAMADRNTLAGMVRALDASEKAGIRLVVGCRLDLADGRSLLCFPTDRAAYGRLTRLLTIGKRRAGKGECRIDYADVAAHGAGQIVVALPPDAIEDIAGEAFRAWLDRLARDFGDRAYLAAQHLYRGDDAKRLYRLAGLAAAAGLPLVATNDVLYHAPERRPLQDVVTCIREGCTLAEAGWRLAAHAERHLKPVAEMRRLFRGYEDAVERTAEIAARCRFSLRDLSYQYPDEIAADGLPPQQVLERLTWEGAARRWPNGDVPDKVRAGIEKELALVAELHYAPYFLTVHDIVRYATAQGILHQGRGSAANSLICYCLGITAIGPERIEMLFERFVSSARNEPPDIDVDFEHERREEVIQYIFRKYTRDRAALAATVICYRTRGALREVGKVFGLSEDVTAALSGTIWGWSEDGIGDAEVRELGLDPADRTLRLALRCASELIGSPRHLSQHVGGFVITRDPISTLVPVENAAMAERTVIEWDKDDLDVLKILKVDVLALGMLTCIRKAFGLIERHYGAGYDLATVPQDCAEVYEMLSVADAVGVFQVESRAQMSMLPRLQPRTFYDLVVEVAIVRPGPIQGGMVHPYLRRRQGLEEITYPSKELAGVLGKTYGVPLFQEQAMRIAIVAAGFTPTESDELRRAMATFRRSGTIGRFRDKFVEGMAARGYERDFAERCFKQIEGFADYGFPESHAASFALLVYVSAWIKRFYPEVFTAALLNSQPMGFYAPAQLVRDARDHGVEVRPVDVNSSEWNCTLEALESAPTNPPLPLWERDGVRGLNPITSATSARSADTPHLPDASRRAPPSPARGEGDLVGVPLSLPASGRAPPSPRWGEGFADIPGNRLALRLGFRQVKGLSEEAAAALVAQRGGEGYPSPEALWRRAGISAAALQRLAEADAFRSTGLDRREALWAVKALGEAPLPLFAAAAAPLPASERAAPSPALPRMPLGEHVVEDYATVGLSLKRHPVAFLRDGLSRRGLVRAGDLRTLPVDRRLRIAGLVLVRQRPGTASGVIFVTLEDETGVANLIVWPGVYARFRRALLGATLLACTGRLQREGAVIHVVAERLDDWSPMLASLRAAPGRGDDAAHPPSEKPRRSGGNGTELVIRSRDFH